MSDQTSHTTFTLETRNFIYAATLWQRLDKGSFTRIRTEKSTNSATSRTCVGTDAQCMEMALKLCKNLFHLSPSPVWVTGNIHLPQMGGFCANNPEFFTLPKDPDREFTYDELLLAFREESVIIFDCGDRFLVHLNSHFLTPARSASIMGANYDSIRALTPAGWLEMAKTELTKWWKSIKL